MRSAQGHRRRRPKDEVGVGGENRMYDTGNRFYRGGFVGLDDGSLIRGHAVWPFMAIVGFQILYS